MQNLISYLKNVTFKLTKNGSDSTFTTIKQANFQNCFGKYVLDNQTCLFFKDNLSFPLIDLDETLAIVNGRQDTSQILLEENKTLHLSCYGNGNPNPTITLSRHNEVIETLETIDDKWLNHTIERLQCYDSGSYKCTSRSAGFQNKEKRITVSVQCEFLQFEKINSK